MGRQPTDSKRARGVYQLAECEVCTVSSSVMALEAAAQELA